MNRIPLMPLALLTLAPLLAIASDRPKSPPGESATEVAGKWIEVVYGRPVLRGRQNVFGAGAEYGKAMNAGAPVWRVGANLTTRLQTELPLQFADKHLAPGEYDLFVELKEGAWTLIVSTQPAQVKLGAKAKDKMWGSYGYDPKFDVARVPMAMSKSEAAIDQLTIGFVDMTAKSGKLQIGWEHTVATALFGIGG